MIKKLSKLLHDKFNYELKEYATSEIHRDRSKLLVITSMLFAVSCILLLLDTMDIFPNFMNITILGFLLVVLIIVPVAFQKGNKYNTIIVTPKYIIQRVEKNEFVVIEFNKITDFIIKQEGMLIIENKKKILLGIDLYQDEVEPIVEILEAKGKTFDSSKEYMIRPIIIVIKDNKVSIKDNEKKTSTDKLYAKYHSDFKVLTPGYITEINFRNSFVEDVLVDHLNIVLYLSGFEVKGGHPENTTFENLIVSDAVLIFDHIKLEEVILKDSSKKKADELLKLDLEEVAQYIPKAVISEWKIESKHMKIIFATGVNTLHVTFKYKEAIAGWNEEK